MKRLVSSIWNSTEQTLLISFDSSAVKWYPRPHQQKKLKTSNPRNPMKKQAVCLLALLTLTLNAGGQQVSVLWGRNGETWTPQSRLPDFSFAGYHFGEDPLPRPDVVSNVRNFGAQGDGKHDDTPAASRRPQ